MKYLLDTCVISELISKEPNGQVLEWIDQTNEEMLFLSAITIGELQAGIGKLNMGQRKQILQAWLDDELLLRFLGRILAIDTPVMLRWGVLRADHLKSGRTLPIMDSLIAAQAIENSLMLVTRNTKDFSGIDGIKLFNPWVAKRGATS